MASTCQSERHQTWHERSEILANRAWKKMLPCSLIAWLTPLYERVRMKVNPSEIRLKPPKCNRNMRNGAVSARVAML